MNTIQLECFLAVAEYLNFSRASEMLKITQPAVSHQIQTLEEELEVKLFNRTSKSVSLTQEGFQFLPDAELILKTAFSAKERLGTHKSIVSFEIGCHNHLELNLLPLVLQELIEEFPLLHPSIHLVPFPSLLGMVEDQKLHAAFGIKERQTKSALRFKELYSTPIACICSPEYPLAQYQTLTKDMLFGNFIACTPRFISNTVFSIQSRSISRLIPEQHYFTDSFESIFTLAKAKIGYTLYPDIPHARESGLCYIPVTDLPRVSFGIYYRYDDDFPVLKRFLQLCKDIL